MTIQTMISEDSTYLTRTFDVPSLMNITLMKFFQDQDHNDGDYQCIHNSLNNRHDDKIW